MPNQENQCEFHIANVRFTLISASTPLPFSLRRNAEVREITQLSRQQVTRLMNELRTEVGVRPHGRNKTSRWLLPGTQKR